MSKEIKAGDFVYVSDISEEQARENRAILFRVAALSNDGYVTASCKYKYAVYPDDVKVLLMDEYKALIENKNPSIENVEAGQELNHYQVLKWIEKYGSKSGLQHMIPNGLWVGSESPLNHLIDTKMRYRVAPKKVNDPDDPTTWEKGVAIFARDSEYEHWVLDSFVEYDVGGCGFIFRCEDCGWKYAKLATPKQVEAWKLINDEFLD